MATVIAEDGVSLYAESHGAGIPVILSNGLCTTCENFRPQVDAFVDAGAQLILWDYRGHGRSDSPDDPNAYAMDRVLDDLGRVLDWAAPGARALVGGVSFGGLASLHFAHMNPERVLGLILIATGPGFKNPAAAARWSELTERSAALIERDGPAAFANGPAAPTLIGLRPDLPAEHSVEHVSNPRGAVVPVVVVAVMAILVRIHRLDDTLEVEPLGGREVQGVHDDGTILGPVIRGHPTHVEALHRVEHATPCEPLDEVLLTEVEDAPVVGYVRSGAGVSDPDRIVAEALPDGLPGSHRDEANLEVGSRNRQVPAYLGRRLGPQRQGRQDKSRQSTEPPHASGLPPRRGHRR